MPLDRRAFLAVLSGATLSWPRAVDALARQLAPGGAPDDEVFWGLVRRQFLIPPDRIYLNNGTLGPSPRVVVDAVIEHTRRVAETRPPGVAWDDLKQSLSVLLGGDPKGFVFPRNTTEAMNFVAHGLDLDADAEVLTTDQLARACACVSRRCRCRPIRRTSCSKRFGRGSPTGPE